MKTATLIALAAALGNMLQGWDNGSIAGALLYIKPDFELDAYKEGILVAASLVGAWVSALCSGPCADWVGRKRVMLVSAILYTLSSILMLWSPDVNMLIFSRVIIGGGIGIAVTIVPIYIAEISPPEVRGQLSTFPQFLGCGGLFVAYLTCFLVSLLALPSWRFMLSSIVVPATLYCILVVWYLPESPRWLVSKGKMVEAAAVLRRLCGKIDVSNELTLLVEGLAQGTTCLEEWVLEPVANDIEKASTEEDGTVTWVAKPTRLTSTVQQSTSFMVDSTVNLIGCFQQHDDEHHHSDIGDELGDDTGFDEDYDVIVDDETLTTPLLVGHSSINILTRKLSVLSVEDTMVASIPIGGGWQLGWKQEQDEMGEREVLKHVYLSSPPDLNCDDSLVPTPALVGKAAQSTLSIASVGPAMVHPAETASRAPEWSELLQDGVLRGLVIGVTLQVLQQFSGINAVLYYVPQILQQAGADVLLAKLGLGSESASIFAGGVACTLMLPAIVLTMYLMDRTGRRKMLLVTIPILLFSLVIMVVANTIMSAGLLHSAASFFGVILYVCTFVMGLGPIPNILCSEIFPTRVRGLCIGICQISFWTCNIILTNLFPILLQQLGLGGIFGIFAIIVAIAWVFTWVKVPETKGLPLELITDLLKAR